MPAHTPVVLKQVGEREVVLFFGSSQLCCLLGCLPDLLTPQSRRKTSLLFFKRVAFLLSAALARHSTWALGTERD